MTFDTPVSAGEVDAGDISRRSPPRGGRWLPTIDDISIPSAPPRGEGWTEQMHEMADFVGEYATLMVVERFGGDRVYISDDVEKSPFVGLLDEQSLKRFAAAYCCCYVSIPTGKAAVARAKRAGLLSAARRGIISKSDVARILGTSRTYLAHLVNGTSEGADVEPITLPAPGSPAVVKRVADRLVAQLALAGVPAATITAIWTSIFVAVDADLSPISLSIGTRPSNGSASCDQLALLKRAADAVVDELSAFNINPDAVDAACGSVLALLDRPRADPVLSSFIDVEGGSDAS